MNARGYPPEIRELVLRRVLEEGWTRRAAAKASGVSQSAVRDWARLRRKEQGIAGGREAHSRYNDQQKWFAVRLIVEKGATTAFAARSVGASPGTVLRSLREARQGSERAAVPIRALVEAARLMAEDGIGRREVARMLGLRQAEISDDAVLADTDAVSNQCPGQG